MHSRAVTGPGESSWALQPRVGRAELCVQFQVRCLCHGLWADREREDLHHAGPACPARAPGPRRDHPQGRGGALQVPGVAATLPGEEGHRPCREAGPGRVRGRPAARGTGPRWCSRAGDWNTSASGCVPAAPPGEGCGHVPPLFTVWPAQEGGDSGCLAQSSLSDGHQAWGVPSKPQR